MIKLLFPVNRWSLIGSVLLIFGAFYSFFCLIPGHRQKEEEIKVFLRQYRDSSPLLKKLLGK